MGEVTLTPLPSLTVTAFFPLLPLPELAVKTHCDCSKEILLCADICQVTTRSGQVFDTQVFAYNYQVALQVAEVQQISRGYDEAALLLVLVFFLSKIFKGTNRILFLILCFSWSNSGVTFFATKEMGISNERVCEPRKVIVTNISEW